jgi:hypothetical protein
VVTMYTTSLCVTARPPLLYDWLPLGTECVSLRHKAFPNGMIMDVGGPLVGEFIHTAVVDVEVEESDRRRGRGRALLLALGSGSVDAAVDSHTSRFSVSSPQRVPRTRGHSEQARRVVYEASQLFPVSLELVSQLWILQSAHVRSHVITAKQQASKLTVYHY